MSQNATPFTRKKLTKKFFMALPEGVYLVSNIYSSSSREPVFRENISPLSERSEQWKRIVEASANNRLCSVFDIKTGVLVKREKLTKKFLMQLPDGVFLVGNPYRPTGKQTLEPAFEEKVSPLSERSEQWKRIVEASANNRLCNVFDTKKDQLFRSPM